MRRALSLIGLALLAFAADCVSVAAQQSGRVYKIGYLHLGSPDYVMMPMELWRGGPGAAFRDRLKDSGYVVGKNVVVEERHAFGDHDRVTAEAAALVASGVDVIVTFGTPLTVAAIQATKRIPIVFGFVSDPVEKGMITSLARPGGNVTGMAVLIANAKVWQYLREVAPDTVRIGYLVNVLNQPAASRTEAYEALAQARVTANASAVGVEPIKLAVKSLAEIESGFAELEAMGKAGTIIGADGVFIDWRAQIMALALRHRLPTACSQRRLFAEAGCLVTHTEDVFAIMRGVAVQVTKVLSGISPADIPVEQPTNYKVIVNLKTAKAIGLTVPTAALAKADEIIDD